MKEEIRLMKLARTLFISMCTKNKFRCASAIGITDRVILKGIIYAQYDVCKFMCSKESDGYAIKIVASTNKVKRISSTTPMEAVFNLVKAIKAFDASNDMELQSYGSASAFLSVEEYMDEAEEATKLIMNHFGRIFDDSYTARAYIGKTLGPSLNIIIYNVPKSATDLQFSNAKLTLKFMLHLTNNSGQLVPMDKFELECFSQSYQSRDKGIKFRKISGKSPLEVANKFNTWVTKNKVLLLEDY